LTKKTYRIVVRHLIDKSTEQLASIKWRMICGKEERMPDALQLCNVQVKGLET
jgi:hypothetical protein